MIISPDKFVSMPWKNGMGQTLELAKKVNTENGVLVWRLSIAAVLEDGAFSCFEDIDRTLLLLDGNGITLKVSDSSVHSLTESLQMARFRGDEQTSASLHDGPISDFNVMVNRNYCQSRVTSHTSTTSTYIDVNCDLLLVYPVKGDLQLNMKNTTNTDFQLIPENHLLKVRKPRSETIVMCGATAIVTQIIIQI